MAKMTFKQKVFFVGGIVKGKGGNVPGGNPDIVPTFTFITDESGAILTTESGADIMTENSQT